MQVLCNCIIQKLSSNKLSNKYFGNVIPIVEYFSPLPCSSALKSDGCKK